MSSAANARQLQCSLDFERIQNNYPVNISIEIGRYNTGTFHRGAHSYFYHVFPQGSIGPKGSQGYVYASGGGRGSLAFSGAEYLCSVSN
jgi:hypothetical protein